jgi:hypothetical protein
MKRAVHFKVGKELLEMMNPHITEVSNRATEQQSGRAAEQQ